MQDSSWSSAGDYANPQEVSSSTVVPLHDEVQEKKGDDDKKKTAGYRDTGGVRRARIDSLDTAASLEAFAYSHTPHWNELTGQPIYKLGIVIPTRTKVDRHLAQIYKPGTSCMVRAVAVLEDNEAEHEPGMMQRWLEHHRLADRRDDISIYWGPDSFERLLSKSSLDAVYIIVPSE